MPNLPLTKDQNHEIKIRVYNLILVSSQHAHIVAWYDPNWRSLQVRLKETLSRMRQTRQSMRSSPISTFRVSRNDLYVRNI